MNLLSFVDISVIIGFFCISLIIGVAVSRNSGKSNESFFLSGRNMPWWLLGISMVATTFSADTPNLVADIVRSNGVAGNWVWWAFLLTGMLTVFFYSKLWRRLEITTDLAFYELRYSGKNAAFLRGFRAIYLGVVFNLFIMSIVCLAAVKIGGVFGFSSLETLTVAGLITVLYSLLGGLKGVIITDFFQFLVAMVGSIWATYYIVNLPEIGGVHKLIKNPLVNHKIDFLPDFNNPASYIPIFVIPLAVQWWSSWYPGSEPGGGGYIVQRMLSAKNEKNATFATLFFNIAHYAIRPWPWLLIALSTLVIYPKTYNEKDISHLKIAPNTQEILSSKVSKHSVDKVKEIFLRETDYNSTEKIDDVYFLALANLYTKYNNTSFSDKKKFEKSRELVPLQLAAPKIEASKIGHDLSYPLMIKSLPKGLLGLVLASLIAAFMSTISTHLNWGSSYVVNDLYKRFINKNASDKKMVFFGRISIAFMMILASLLTMVIEEAKQGFDLLINIGAGTGLLFILRWFWFKINAITEIVAMVVSFVIGIFFFLFSKFGYDFEFLGQYKMLIILFVTTCIWVLTAIFTKDTDNKTINNFKEKAFGKNGKLQYVSYKFLAMIMSVFGVYFMLFSMGKIIYGQIKIGILLFVISLFNWVILFLYRKKILA